MLAATSDGAGPFPDLTADALVFEVFHDRDHGGRLQGEAVQRLFWSAESFRGSISPGGFDGRGRQTLEAVHIVDDQLPLVGGVEHVFRVLLSDLGQLRLDLLDAFFLLRW